MVSWSHLANQITRCKNYRGAYIFIVEKWVFIGDIFPKWCHRFFKILNLFCCHWLLGGCSDFWAGTWQIQVGSSFPALSRLWRAQHRVHNGFKYSKWILTVSRRAALQYCMWSLIWLSQRGERASQINLLPDRVWQRAPPRGLRGIICRRAYLQAASPARLLTSSSPSSTGASQHSSPTQRPLNGHRRPAGPICVWATESRPICHRSLRPLPSLTQAEERGRRADHWALGESVSCLISTHSQCLIMTRVCIGAAQ